MQEFAVRVGDGFEVDVTPKIMVNAQPACDLDDLLHCVVGIADDAGAEKQAFDVIAAIEVERQVDDFLHRKPGALHI